MAQNPIAKKLGMKDGMRTLMVNAPAEYEKMLEPLPAGLSISNALKSTYPFVQYFVTSKAELTEFAPQLLMHAAPGAIVWITYPKKTSGVKSDLYREAVWDAMSGTGWGPVSSVAIDDVWSGLRFRAVSEIRSRSPR
jgi:hypothetical protein